MAEKKKPNEEFIAGPSTSKACADFSPKQTDDGFNMLDRLVDLYPLPKLICHYLPYEDLRTLKSFSKSWKSAVDGEVKKRTFAGWMMVRLAKKSKKLNYYSENFDYVNRANSIVFYSPSRINKNHNYMHHFHNDYGKIHEDTLRVSTKCLNEFDEYSETLFGYKILRLPEIPGIKIRKLHLYEVEEFPNLDSVFDAKEEVECLVAFSHHYITEFLELLSVRQDIFISIGGGVMDRVEMCNANNEWSRGKQLYLLAFTKVVGETVDFYSASVVIKQNYEKDLQNAKERVQYREHTMIFYFYCHAKKTNAQELKILKSLFPNVLLIAIGVHGEIGITIYKPPSTKEDETVPKRRKLDMDYYHEFTSIFVYISWGKLKK